MPLYRFPFFFSTHEVRLLGWRLVCIIPLPRHAELLSVLSLESRYYGLSRVARFVSDIEVISYKVSAKPRQMALEVFAR